jgi:hypothetical protein
MEQQKPIKISNYRITSWECNYHINYGISASEIPWYLLQGWWLYFSLQIMVAALKQRNAWPVKMAPLFSNIWPI